MTFQWWKCQYHWSDNVTISPLICLGINIYIYIHIYIYIEIIWVIAVHIFIIFAWSLKIGAQFPSCSFTNFKHCQCCPVHGNFPRKVTLYFWRSANTQSICLTISHDLVQPCHMIAVLECHMTWSHDSSAALSHDLITWSVFWIVTWPDHMISVLDCHMTWSHDQCSGLSYDLITWSVFWIVIWPDHMISVLDCHMTWSHDLLWSVTWPDHMTCPGESHDLVICRYNTHVDWFQHWYRSLIDCVLVEYHRVGCARWFPRHVEERRILTDLVGGVTAASSPLPAAAESSVAVLYLLDACRVDDRVSYSIE